MYERTYHDKAIKTDKRVLKREKLRRKRRRILFSILAILLLVGVVFFLRLRILQVDTVEVKGNEVVDSMDVSTAVLASITGKYIWVIPRSNVLLVSPHKLEAVIENTFTRAKSAHITRTGAHTITVAIEEYSVTYLWCTQESDCYAMDENGTVYSEAPYYSGDAYPRIYKGSLQPLPFSPLTALELKLVHESEDHLRTLSIVPEAYYFDSARTMRIRFAHEGAAATLYIDPMIPLEESFEKLYTGLRTDPLQQKFNNPKDVLQYLDLRYDGKVIYKFANTN
jgi:hypothetical protein